jgi:hypothetical protein
MHHEFEAARVSHPHPPEVANVSRRDAAEADGVGERHDQSVHEAKAEFAAAPVDLHDPEELVKRGRGVTAGLDSRPRGRFWALTPTRWCLVGIVASIQTHGSLANWHPHLHPLVTDGGFGPAGSFVPLPLLRCGPPDRKVPSILHLPNVGVDLKDSDSACNGMVRRTETVDWSLVRATVVSLTVARRPLYGPQSWPADSQHVLRIRLPHPDRWLPLTSR